MKALNLPAATLARGLAIAAVVILPATNPRLHARSPEEARVTRIVRDVKLLPSGADAKPAAVNDEINAETAVRTGDRSRSELTFVDLTIERLGANTVFHFDKAGRAVELDTGSMLLRVPKDSGGAQMQTRAVTVGVSGTTVILEATGAGRNKLIILEGEARLSLKRNPRESVDLRGGQMEDVPAGATTLPRPVNINLNDVMKRHPLITDFEPLPSQDLIYTTIRDQSGRGQVTGGGGPNIIPPVSGPPSGRGPIGSGSATGPGTGIGGQGSGGNQPRNPSRQTGGQNTTGTSRPPKNVRPPKPGRRNPSPKSTPRPKPKTG
jgi:hypothetical protein